MHINFSLQADKRSIKHFGQRDLLMMLRQHCLGWATVVQGQRGPENLWKVIQQFLWEIVTYHGHFRQKVKKIISKADFSRDKIRKQFFILCTVSLKWSTSKCISRTQLVTVAVMIFKGRTSGLEKISLWLKLHYYYCKVLRTSNTSLS